MGSSAGPRPEAERKKAPGEGGTGAATGAASVHEAETAVGCPASLVTSTTSSSSTASSSPAGVGAPAGRSSKLGGSPAPEKHSAPALSAVLSSTSRKGSSAHAPPSGWNRSSPVAAVQ